MPSYFARISMLAFVDLLFAKIRQTFSQLLQPSQVADNTSDYAISPLNTPNRGLEGVRRGVQNGDDSQALRESARFCSRQYMQPSHKLRSERHGQLTQRLSAILPTYLVVQHMLDSVLVANQVVQRACGAGNQQRLTVKRGKKDNSLLILLPFCNLKWGGCQSISLPSQAPDSISRSSSGPDADPGYPESNYSYSNCSPSSTRRQSVPPHYTVVFPKRTAAKYSVTPAQALTPPRPAAFCHDLGRIAGPVTRPIHTLELAILLEHHTRQQGHRCWFVFNAGHRARVRFSAPALLPALPDFPDLSVLLAQSGQIA